jgi:RND family efflux transporter MFP subunit
MIREPAVRTAMPRAGGLSGRRLPVTWLAVVMLIGVIGLVGAGTLPRVRRHQDLEAAARAVKDGVPVVNVIFPVRGKPVADFTLPGTIQAIQETALYARVDGYLKRRLVDIGDRVVAEQVLAEVDTPELDQQLYQAKATLAQAQAARAQAVASLEQARSALVHTQAQLEYNGTNLWRWRTLKERELVAQQDVDDRQVLVTTAQADVKAAQANVVALDASVAAADANVVSNQANVQRLVEMQSFQRIRAPFPGIVTVRNVDNGALISSGSATSNTPLFRMAQIDSLRIFVSVPQTFVTDLKPGLTAELMVREFPQRVFPGKVVSTAGALDPTSRTLLTEVRIQNEGEVLRPGMYTDVRFQLIRTAPPLVIPSNALIIRSGPPRVATVGADGKVRFSVVQLGRDFGTTVEVVGGLSERDRLLVTPPDTLQEGAVVRIPASPPGADDWTGSGRSPVRRPPPRR